MRLKHVLDARSLSEIHETRSGFRQTSRDHRDQVNYHIGTVSWPRRGVFLSSPESNHIAFVLQRYDPFQPLPLLASYQGALEGQLYDFRLHLIMLEVISSFSEPSLSSWYREEVVLSAF